MQGKNPHIVYKFFHDPAHGWLEVPLSELLDLEIADKISTYSYKSELRGMAYLEEDCDLTVFLNAIGYYGDNRAFFEATVPECDVHGKSPRCEALRPEGEPGPMERGSPDESSRN